MRYLRLLPLLITIAVILSLNTYWSSAIPALGKVLDPINGVLASAEHTDNDYNLNLKIAGLRAPVEIWFEDRLVPHIRAQNNHDLYLAQGYVHACLRLWQMDFQTRFAAGRISEVVGAKAIELDRGQRRKGMVMAAERSLKTIMAEPHTREMITAYTEGINSYVHSISYREWPLEYKLIGYAPEDWTPLKTSLMMKNMADDLTGKTDDIAYTLLREKLGEKNFDFLFPEKIQGSKPVIPEGTKFAPASLPTPEFPGDSVWAHLGSISTAGNGSIFPGFIAKNAASRANTGNIGANTDQIGANTDKIGANTGNIGANSGNIGANTGNIGANTDKIGANTGKIGANINNSCTNIGSISASIGSLYTNIVSIGANDGANALNTPNFHDGAEHLQQAEQADGTGSNNWAISGAHTASGAPILCNDPHLSLSLPSLWFEMQLTAPGINSYGVSLPGAPGIVIGFNDSLSWGLTNNYRDVKDFYDITPGDAAPTGRNLSASGSARWEAGKQYLFCGKNIPFEDKIERIKVKGAADFIDTVRYTLHGPVMYDPTFPDPAKSGHYLACTWMAHRGSNELLAVWLLNRAKDYDGFTTAISHFSCPAQNFAYADRAGNIAMWGQGQFVNKWRGQGKYVMEGRDSATLWGQDIPWQENPHVLNPRQGYVASANQSVTDSTYPYWYNGMFFEFRSWRINEILAGATLRALIETNNPLDTTWWPTNMQNVDLKEMQNDVHSFLLDSIFSRIWLMTSEFNKNKFEKNYPDFFEVMQHDYPDWSLYPQAMYQLAMSVWWSQLYKNIWQPHFGYIPGARYPSEERTIQLILSDSTSAWYDDPSTPQRETLREIVQKAFSQATDSMKRITTGAEWYKVKNTTVRHLARIPAFSYDHLKIGGWSNTINACTQDHGPSWRMIVEMGKDSIRAYGVYPGGQSGNPGSPHYADFLDQWVAGQYNVLAFLNAATTKNPYRRTWTLHP